jgi:hypothetical protein
VPDSPELPRWKRICASAIALVVVYGNLAVTFQPQKLGITAWSGLPRPFVVQDAFLIPGMFSGFTPFNFEYFIEGERARDRRFVPLRLEEYFPLRYALTYTQLFAAHQWDMLGPSAQRAAWATLAKKIKARHNRLHPSEPIARLRFGVLTFPQSKDGYRAGKDQGRTWRYLWYTDP